MTTEDVIEFICGLAEENKKLKNALAEQTAMKMSVHGKLAEVRDGRTGSDRPNRQKLSEFDVKDIRRAFSGGMKQADLARSYGVNPATISRIVRYHYH